MSVLRRLLRAPALHFIVLGGLLFALDRRWAPPPRPLVVLTGQDVGQLRTEWTQAHGAAPSPAVEGQLVDEAVDDEILHREAIALGLADRDPAVRERLVRLGRFVAEDDSAANDAAAEREARRLGLERGDLVVRRHLVQMMRLAAARLGPADLPSEAELQDYLDRHAERFAQAPRVRLTHVYLARARHGDGLARDAAALLAELQRTGAGSEAAATRGDAFIRGAEVGPATGAELERAFGPALARLAAEAPLHAWAGPVASPYGLHLIRVRERVPGAVPALAAVRTQVLHRLLAERSADRLQQRLQALRARYDVRVERESGT